MLLNRVRLLALSILVVGLTSSADHYVTDHYIYWTNASIQSPELFAIDLSNERIVLAAKNNVCHLTLDLMDALNVRNASPTYNEIHDCVNDAGIFKPIEKCHNFHHIILFPNANTITINSQTIAGNETVLVCGSNAYHPKCIYRNRTDLSELKVYSGVEFSPYDEETVSASLLSSNGKLLSGTSLNVNADKYGFTMSNSPFDGTTAVRTLPGLLMFNKPKFVDIYERGDYFYFFMREIAEESNSDSQIYSRAARVCKNETGTQYQNKGYSVFTTFLKARITCESQLKLEEGFPYIYNDLQDTVHIADGTIDSSVDGEYLYGIFTSPVNGPAGSVLCVYTFDKGTNDDLSDVFEKNYLIQSGENQWTSATNLHPVTCGNRSTSEADDYFLMEPVVAQARSPLIQEDGLLYQRLVVDQVTGVDGVKYDVLIIAAIDEESNVYLLKKTYVSSRGGDHVHTSETISLNHTSNQIVGKMELYKNNDKVSVYLSTNEGIYAVNISDCSKYKDCSACVRARDPYCAYNSTASSCVSTLSNKGQTLLQDIVNGNTESCPIISTTSVRLTPTTSTIIDNVITSTLTMTSSVCTNTIVFTTIARETVTATTTVVITPTPRIAIVSTTPPTVKPTVHIPIRPEPSIVPISEGTDSGEDYIWTIVAACGGLIVGIVLGFFCFALVRNKDRFCWGKFFSRRNGYNYDTGKVDDFEMTQVHKTQETRNNSYSKVPQRPSTPPITKFNPTLANGGPCHKVTDSPVLSKYSNTERTHNRSMSSGGQFIPPLFPVPTNGTALSPIGPNLRQTFHVEEPMSNSQRQKFGKNMVGRQLSKEYPMTNSFHAHTNGYHVKTGSLDLDYDKFTHK